MQILFLSSCNKQSGNNSGTSFDASANSSQQGGNNVQSSAPQKPDRLAHLNQEDKDRLLRLEDTSWGFVCYIADELYFKNNGYKYEFRELLDFDISNPKTNKSISYNIMDLFKGKGSKTAPEIANEIFDRMQKELGEPPQNNPNAPEFMESLFMGHDQAQKLRYYDKYKKMMLKQSAQSLIQAKKMFQAGQKKDAADIVEDVACELKWRINEETPLFNDAWNLYYQITGLVLCFDTKKDDKFNTISHSCIERTPQDAAAKGYPLPPVISQSVQNNTSQPAHPNQDPDPAVQAKYQSTDLNQAMQDIQKQAEEIKAKQAEENAARSNETLEKADEEIKAASQKWQSGDKAGAVLSAKKAYEIRLKLLGENDPKTIEVKKMLEGASK